MMANPRYLTKSRFKLAAECPTKLFYTGKDKQYRNLKAEDSFLEMLAEGGFQVGELAKLYYPEGIEVNATDHATAEAQTNELLKRDRVVIFEPAIRFGDLFARVDIMIKDGNDYKLIEVKAKSYDSSAPKILGVRGDFVSGMRPYIEDVAFQAFVFRSAFPEAKLKTFLMMPDKAVQTSVSGLNQLFKIQREGKKTKVITSPFIEKTSLDKNILALVSVDEFVEKINKEGVKVLGHKSTLPELAQEWALAYKTDQKIKPHPSAQCGKCEFRSMPFDGLKNGFKECWAEAYQFTDADFEKGTVLDIYNFAGKDKLIDKGCIRLTSVQPDDIQEKDEGAHLSLSERQWMQIRGIPKNEDRGGYWLAESELAREMNSWIYPYHFIDFETSTVAIPFHAEMRPYEPVAFQFSHHVMHENGDIEHAGDFLLADPGVFPNFKFAQALKDELDKDSGTIFMWSRHENTILSKIIQQLENTSNPPANSAELIDFIKSLTTGGKRQMYDLCKLSSRTYYHVGTKGSSSIKKVLPAVFKSSNFLREKYGHPVYGSPTGIQSKNFSNFTWWVDAGFGIPVEPYDLLKEYGSTLIGQNVLSGEDPDELVIAEGGAAATAYARLQFEDMSSESRQKIKEALLRYCELDTLAMVMIVQAWRDFL